METSSALFDLTSAAVLLRILCGLFFIPHAHFKITKFDDAVGFFTSVGFTPAKFYVSLGLALDIICATGLILGLYTKWVALLAVAWMAACAIASAKGKKGWLWVAGGPEYPVFWGLTSAIVAVMYW